eukprot:4446041-Prymnesium_polylepis.1
MATVTAMPEDAFAVVVSKLGLPADALALTLVCRAYWNGDCRSALNLGCVLAAAKVLCCNPSETRRVAGCPTDEDGIAVVAFVMRAHGSDLPLAAANHTIVARDGFLQ